MRKTNEYKVYTPDDLDKVCITMMRQGIDQTLKMMDYKEPFIDVCTLDAVYEYAKKNQLLYVFDKYGDLKGIAVLGWDNDLYFVQPDEDIDTVHRIIKGMKEQNYRYDCEMDFIDREVADEMQGLN